MAIAPTYKPSFEWYFKLNDPKNCTIILCDNGNAIDFQVIPKSKYALARRITRAQNEILARVNVVRKALNPALANIVLGKEAEASGPQLKIVSC